MNDEEVLVFLSSKYVNLIKRRADYKAAELKKEIMVNEIIDNGNKENRWRILMEIERKHPELIIKEPSKLEIKELGKMIRRSTLELESGMKNEF